ncbi:unnamed protein product [Prunus armeniaca]
MDQLCIVVRFLLLQIIYEINFKFVEELKKRIGLYYNRLSWMSMIEEGAVKDFYELWPQKFQCKTSGVTQRRWIVVSNPSLCALISKWLGTEAWIRDVDLLTGLRAYAADPDLQQEWMMTKRIHEYKRQLLNILGIIHRYDCIKGAIIILRHCAYLFHLLVTVI